MEHEAEVAARGEFKRVDFKTITDTETLKHLPGKKLEEKLAGSLWTREDLLNSPNEQAIRSENPGNPTALIVYCSEEEAQAIYRSYYEGTVPKLSNKGEMKKINHLLKVAENSANFRLLPIATDTGTQATVKRDLSNIRNHLHNQWDVVQLVSVEPGYKPGEIHEGFTKTISSTGLTLKAYCDNVLVLLENKYAAEDKKPHVLELTNAKNTLGNKEDPDEVLSPHRQLPSPATKAEMPLRQMESYFLDHQKYFEFDEKKRFKRDNDVQQKAVHFGAMIWLIAHATTKDDVTDILHTLKTSLSNTIRGGGLKLFGKIGADFYELMNDFIKKAEASDLNALKKMCQDYIGLAAAQDVKPDVPNHYFAFLKMLSTIKDQIQETASPADQNKPEVTWSDNTLNYQMVNHVARLFWMHYGALGHEADDKSAPKYQAAAQQLVLGKLKEFDQAYDKVFEGTFYPCGKVRLDVPSVTAVGLPSMSALNEAYEASYGHLQPKWCLDSPIEAVQRLLDDINATRQGKQPEAIRLLKGGAQVARELLSAYEDAEKPERESYAPTSPVPGKSSGGESG